MKPKAADSILRIAPYEPGKPIEELAREYGIQSAIKLASNENPLGPSPGAVAAVQESLGRLHRYPDGAAHDLSRRLADHLGVMPENIVLGNGSDELLGMLARVFLQPGDQAVLPRPSFLMYEITVKSAGAEPIFAPLRQADMGLDLKAMKAAIGEKTRMVFLCNPNNPTGTIISRGEFADFMADLPSDILIIADEAYMEFVREPDCFCGLNHLDARPPVVTLRTFSKAYGLAGLRIGYGVMDAEIAGLLHRIRPPFNASIPAQAGALAALDDRAFLQKTLSTVHQGIDFLRAELAAMGLTAFPTQSNFFLVDLGCSAQAVFEKLLEHGVIVRSMRSYGYPQYIRVNAGLPEENQRFLDALKQVLGG